MNEPAFENTQLLHRLAAIVSEKEVAILNDLYERLERYSAGVDGERFRIVHKNSRNEIDNLTGRFIREDFEPKRTYRPTLLALPLVENEKAEDTLHIADAMIRYMAAEYEREPGRQLSLMEISKHLDVNLARVADAMGYLIEAPVSGSRRSGLPNAPDWYIIPGEQMLDFPDLQAVLEQLLEWAERRVSAASQVLSSGVMSEAPGQKQAKIMRTGKNVYKVVAAILGLIATVLTILAFFR